jgi:hypothetical protein
VAGQYHNTTGGDCNDIAAGSFGSTDGTNYVALGATSAVLCLDGSYSPTGDGACDDVPAGSFGSADGSTYAATGATSAVACVDGTYSADGSGACATVGAGSFGSADGSTYAATGATSAVVCPVGTSNVDGVGACDADAAGGGVGWAIVSGATDCAIVTEGDGSTCVQDTVGNYGSNEDCVFTYTGGTVTVTRVSWTLESSTGCTADFVEVGGTNYCGVSGTPDEEFPATMALSGDTTFTFHSDGSIENTGASSCAFPRNSKF